MEKQNSNFYVTIKTNKFFLFVKKHIIIISIILSIIIGFGIGIGLKNSGWYKTDATLWF
jgi:hypothetical protein